MLNKEIEKLLVDQVNFEILSAYLYLSMGTYADSIDVPGFANWFKVQWEEEIFHSQKLANYVTERGGRVILEAIEKPKSDWNSLLDTFQDALSHEEKVTARINNIMTKAVELKDHATISFLNWFIDEQVEEEGNVDAIIKKLKMLGNSGHGLFMLDKEFAARTFVPPAK